MEDLTLPLREVPASNQFLQLRQQPCLHGFQRRLGRALGVVIHFLHGIPPYRAFAVVPIAFQVVGPAGKKMPVQVRVSIAQQLLVHLFSMKGFGHSFRHQGHLLQILHLGGRG